MNCANHPDTAAVAYCRTCGKPLCQACERSAQGTIFCEEHVASAATADAAGATPGAAAAPPQQPYSPYAPPQASPYTAPSDLSASPGLAFVLGLIPGVGAIYNGQYAKGIVHVVILGLIISIMNAGAAGGLEPLFGFLIPLWFFYMAFEAYHTARRRVRGEPLDEFSSIFPIYGSSGFPVGPVVLILVGVLFLLNSLDIIRFYQLLRWWPLFLIALGVYLLVARIAAARTVAPASQPGAREALDGR
ncbi:MAG TPA: DUF5668 domain-containing protein [Bryobacteraceae bacterium]|nr:DUF5668 domain-containing protein [Bryobacteraceae bacterium]